MKKSLTIGDIEIYWLNGGVFELDGGPMFGCVPKVLWEKKYPVTEGNNIRLNASPLLIKTPDALVIVETGIGNKLTDKQKKIFRVQKEWSLPADLQAMGIKREEIDYVILTHCDFDHSGGIAMYGENGAEEFTFPNAKHIVQESEWDDAIHPNIRAANTYWAANLKKLNGSENLLKVKGEYDVTEGVSVRQTGGHTRGHQIVSITSKGDTALHLADLLPTHVHFNPLWVMSYDNFPLDAIQQKEELITGGISNNAWFTFYHDPFMRACRFDKEGNVVEKLTAG